MKIALVVLLALVLGIGFVVLRGRTEPPVNQNNQPSAPIPAQKNTSFEVTDALAAAIVQDALENTFDLSTATYTISNIDGKDGPELIIGAIEQTTELYAPATAVVKIATVLNARGEYRLLGTIESPEPARSAPQVRELRDLTGDGVQDMFMTLGFGGASNLAHGFLSFDGASQRLEWIQLRDQAGQTRDAIFLIGGTVTHTETTQLHDVNRDGTNEIVEVFSQMWEPTEVDSAIPNKQIQGVWCLVRVYQWNSNLFAFNRQLAEQFLASLGVQCAM